MIFCERRGGWVTSGAVGGGGSIASAGRALQRGLDAQRRFLPRRCRAARVASTTAWARAGRSPGSRSRCRRRTRRGAPQEPRGRRRRRRRSSARCGVRARASSRMSGCPASSSSSTNSDSAAVSKPWAPPVKTAGRRDASVSPRPCQRERMPQRYRPAISTTPAASRIQRSSFIESQASLRDSHRRHAHGFVDVDRDEA